MKKSLFVLWLILLAPAVALAQWESVETGLAPESVNWNDVQFLDANNGYLGGVNPTDGSAVVLKTTDGGTTWTNVSPPNTLGVQGLFFLDAMTGWICGGRPVGTGAGSGMFIKKTTDGGATWVDQTPNPPPVHIFKDVLFFDANRGWAIAWEDLRRGPMIFTTTDGGATWTGRSSELARYLAITYVDANVVLACGDRPAGGVIVRSTDGGQTWRVVLEKSSAVRGLFALGGGHVWAVGGGRRLPDGTIVGARVYTSTDGGQTWTEKPEILENAAATDVAVAGQVGVLSGFDITNLGFIMTTNDGGDTWEIALNTGAPLTRVSLASGNAYVCGAQNQLFKYVGFYSPSP